MGIFRGIETIIYKVRDFFWNYPDILFFGDTSFVEYFRKWYLKTRPFSHFVFSGIVYLTLIFLVVSDTNAVLGINKSEFIEGVIVGVDENNQLKGIDIVNPLIPTNSQIEKDVSSLIFQELLRVNQNGEVEMVLLESYGEIKPGNDYRFKLKSNVSWQDGELLTTKDVVETINLLKRLDKNSDTASNYSNVVSNQLDEIKIIDNYTFELKLKSADGVLPTFLEAISFKILPAKYISELNDITVFDKSNAFVRYPIGTGMYQFSSSASNSVTLVRNEKYFEKLPQIKKIRFKLYPDEKTAFDAIATSRIHAISGISSENVEKVVGINNYELFRSNIIYNQYWALYFNLDENSGDKVLQSANIRRAINYGINKSEIIDSIEGMGEVAFSTIPKSSFAFADEIKWIDYDPEYGSQILEEAGWILDEGNGYRKKDGVALEFDLVIVDNEDRKKVANVIKSNLSEIGIKINIKADPISTVVDKYILPKHFDILLYGQVTFLDPDRFELFHSSQRGNVLLDSAAGNENTGLNISSYVSSALDSKVEGKELIKVPKVDTLLEDGRQYVDRDQRAKFYREFEEIISNEVPVIFLYHPIYPYIVNQRVHNVEIKDMVNLEDRFRGIADWEIKV